MRQNIQHLPRRTLTLEALQSVVRASLEDDKAEAIAIVDLKGKADFADAMIVASGRSQRHVDSIAQHLEERLKASGLRYVMVEGRPDCDWVLVDAGNVIVHIFRPETRDYYNLEKMWGADLPALEAV